MSNDGLQEEWSDPSSELLYGLNKVSHPTRIGPYRVLDLLGEGGMGDVYEAEQIEPVRRRVAIKIVKPGMDTREVVARFEAERQALAVMDHPNIARVFDAGSTESGRPYFVMELVRGEPLTEYSDRHKLGTAARIRLVIEICHAVQHAHLKGVIHRDLKPSNVLVTVKDSAPVAKVIDFGIAKAMGLGLTDRTLVTRIGQRIGTPEYMSPEQAEQSGLDVDTRTDIYSLGVMLYELLVGALPFDLRNVSDMALGFALRERDAPTPSARLTTLPDDTQMNIARSRHTDPRALRRELRGDLDWIVMRAMEKDRTRRYATANELATDLERYRRHEPVSARPPSTMYRVRKFVRRNRTAVVAASATLLALSGGLLGTSYGMVAANRSQLEAQREAETSARIATFLADLFRASDPDQARGQNLSARDLLDRGSQRVDQQLADQPVIQARLLGTLAGIYRELGLLDQGRRLAERSLELRRGQFGARHPELASALLEVGLNHHTQGEYDAAAARLSEALDILEGAEIANDSDRGAVAGRGIRIASVLNALGATRSEQARYDEAQSLFERALELEEGGTGTDDRTLATSLYNLALLHRRTEALDTAAALFRRALEIRERTEGADHPSVARTINGLATVYTMQERFDSAEALFRRSLEQKERILGPDHPDVANTVNNLAIVFAQQDQLDQAVPLFERALSIRERVLGDDHPSVAQGLNNLGIAYRTLGRYPEAEAALRRSLSIAERSLGPNHPRVAETLEAYAVLLRLTGRDQEAAAADARANAIRARR